jgi:hypothetical protein
LPCRSGAISLGLACGWRLDFVANNEFLVIFNNFLSKSTISFLFFHFFLFSQMAASNWLQKQAALSRR